MNKRRFFFLLCWLVTKCAIAAHLDSLFIQEPAGKTTTLLKISGGIHYKVFTLSNPERVVLDLEHTSTHLDIHTLSTNSQLVSAMRSGSPKPGTLRIVFDVKSAVSIYPQVSANELRVTFLPKGQASVSNRQTTMPQGRPNSTLTPKTVSSGPALLSHTPVQVKHRPARTLRDVIIVLDPGHGGKDPGAIGAQKNAEKRIVLAIALKLQQLINRQPGMRAILTRNGDYYVGLRERLNIARKHNADIFISIHADAFINKHSHGVSVFALSPTGATSEAARWLAEKENYSELGGVNLAELDDQNGLIRSVLIDLSQTATISASLKMGSRVLYSLNKMTNLHHGNVEQARFMVLKSPDIPSILIETGFITNLEEERKLTNPAYQDRLTQAIFAGIKTYFWEYPPAGSRVEAMGAGNTYENKAFTRKHS